jgi:5-(carboxyamino)imidazole ribonucleotide mutase
VPVATVAVNGARNAGLLAVRILALEDERLAEALTRHLDASAAQVRAADEELQKRYADPRGSDAESSDGAEPRLGTLPG